MYAELAHEISQENGTTTLRIRGALRASAADLAKKVGQELVVSAGREKRTIILPPPSPGEPPRGQARGRRRSR